MTIDVKEPPGLMDFLYSVLLILLRHKFGIKLDYFINIPLGYRNYLLKPTVLKKVLPVPGVSWKKNYLKRLFP